MQKVRWTPEEDDHIKRLHALKSPMIMLKAALPGRTTVSIYARVNKLGLKRAPRILPINAADFSSKTNKRKLEKETAAIGCRTERWFLWYSWSCYKRAS
ncbi:hypothetical protein JZU46_03110 [bacterium]|nr:hypothetical protein [bacterium]